jgi:hypothetical protein
MPVVDDGVHPSCLGETSGRLWLAFESVIDPNEALQVPINQLYQLFTEYAILLS